MYNRLLVSALLALGTITTQPGCAWFRGACATAMPTIAKAQTYAADAETVLEQTQAYLDMLNLPEPARTESNKVLTKARLSLRAAQSMLITATDVCSQPDALQLFADFVRDWGLVEALLAKHGGDKLGASMGASDGSLSTPLIVLRARGLR